MSQRIIDGSYATWGMEREHPSNIETIMPRRPGGGGRSLRAWRRRGRSQGNRAVLGCFLLSVLVGVFIGMQPSVAWSQAANVYVTPNGTATGSCPAGTSTAPNFTPAQFNTATNWGTGSGKIGPGTTVNLCGTFTFAAGTSGLTVHGSGTSGSPITILFQSGAVLQSPYFPGTVGSAGGAIVINGYNYITVNGGTNGEIENTESGSPSETCPSGSACAYQEPTTGVYIANSTGTTVENLSIQSMYVNCGASSDCTDTNGQNSGDIIVDTGTISSLLITGNSLGEARMGFGEAAGDSSVVSNVTISNNTTDDNDWSMIFGGDSSTTVSGLSFYGNYVTNWTDWENPSSTYHQDGIFIYVGSGTTAATANVYSNYFYGNFGDAGGGTAMLWCGSNNPPTVGTLTCNIFNNLFVTTPPGATEVWLGQSPTQHIYNNTFIGPNNGTASAAIILGLSPIVLENNIFYEWDNAIGTYDSFSADVTTSNYNLFNSMVGTEWFSSNIGAGTGPQDTYAEWQAAGYDANSVTGAPDLTTAYTPQTGSAAISAGTDLTSLGMTPLDTSAPATFGVGSACGAVGCVARPSTGPWAIGAYQPTGNAPAAPTDLTATVQ